MVTVTAIRSYGSQLRVQFDDGTSIACFPTGWGLWLPASSRSVAPGSGGEVVDPGSGATPGSVAAPVDDYPWPHSPEDEFSPLRYSYRDCTDFAAWRINRDKGCTSAPWKYTWGNLRITNGNAIGWKPDWITHGWGVSTSPAAGTIGWFGSKVGAYGHVNYVQAVASDGTVHMEEYNWGGSSDPNGTQRYDQRDAAPGSAFYPDAFLSMPT